MKVNIEIASGVEETEVLIRCGQLDETVIGLQNYILKQGCGSQVLALRQGDTDYFVEVKEILFFETQGRVICAHTRDKLFRAEYKLYELEMILDYRFFRCSKSMICNVKKIRFVKAEYNAKMIATMLNGEAIVINRSYVKELKKRLGM